MKITDHAKEKPHGDAQPDSPDAPSAPEVVLSAEEQERRGRIDKINEHLRRKNRTHQLLAYDAEDNALAERESVILAEEIEREIPADQPKRQETIEAELYRRAAEKRIPGKLSRLFLAWKDADAAASEAKSRADAVRGRWLQFQRQYESIKEELRRVREEFTKARGLRDSMAARLAEIDEDTAVVSRFVNVSFPNYDSLTAAGMIDAGRLALAAGIQDFERVKKHYDAKITELDTERARLEKELVECV